MIDLDEQLGASPWDDVREPSRAEADALLLAGIERELPDELVLGSARWSMLFARARGRGTVRAVKLPTLDLEQLVDKLVATVVRRGERANDEQLEHDPASVQLVDTLTAAPSAPGLAA